MFHPWWGAGYAAGFNRGMSIANGNVTTLYRNARVANGISGLSAGDFTSGRFSNVQRVSATQVQQAGLINGRVPLNASAANRRFSDRTVANIPRTSANTQFFSRTQGQRNTTQLGRTDGNAQSTSGYHRFGEPGGNPANQRPAQPAAGTNRPGGLQRFGEPGSSANDRPSGQGGSNAWRPFGNPGSTAPARQPYNPPPQNRPAYNRHRQNRPAPSYSAPRPAPGGHPSVGHSGGGGKGRR